MRCLLRGGRGLTVTCQIRQLMQQVGHAINVVDNFFAAILYDHPFVNKLKKLIFPSHCKMLLIQNSS